MPAQGNIMSDPRTFTVAGRPFRAIHLEGGGMSPTVLAYTFFNQAGVRTAAHMRRILVDTWDRSVLNQAGVRTASHVRRIFIDTWDRSARNRIDRWVMVTVNASAPYDSEGFDLRHEADRLTMEEFLARLSEALP